MMAPTTYQPSEKEQDSVYDEPIQQVNPYYSTMNFNMPNMPPSHSSFQPANWQCAPNDMMWMEVLQSWPANSVMNSPAPVYTGWQTNTMPAWDFHGHNNIVNPQFAQGVPVQTPSPVRTDSTYQPSPVSYEEEINGNNTWNGGWVEGVSPVAEEVVSSVEVGPEAMTIDLPVTVQAPVLIPAPVPWRREEPTPKSEFSEYVTPVTGAPVQPGPVRVEKRRRAATPTVDFDEYFSPVTVTEPSPIPQVPTTQSIPQPMAPARPAAARRDAIAKARRGSHTVFKTQSANSKRGHYASDVWEGHKATIKKLYIDDGKPLRELIRIMEKEHDFPATQRMYKARFKQWGFVKNNTEKVVSQILRTKFERDAAGKLSQFTRNGKDVNLQNYLQRKGMTEYDLVDFSKIPDAALVHVRCRTPPLDIPEDLRLPDRLRFQDTLVMSFKRAFLVWRQEEQDSAFGFQPSVFTWRVTDFPHLSSLIESARLIRSGDGAQGVAALNQAFWSMNTYFGSMDATSSFYFFFHRQSRCWQDDSRIALAVWKFLAAYASARNHNNHPLFHTFKLMYEVVQKEGVTGLRELLAESSNTVADELEKSFGKEHWLKDLIWHRCFPEKSKLRHLQLIRDLRDHGPTKKIVRRLY
ncbi:Filamentous hemagglutinin [Cytospora mali]|uniref:Filamentous hemagglutinin n=1 Tax=Cytospora mali TaxID=578113 RepID=A0A194VGC6_CYTMA|nr:Filamentous hemagglutinin [Valsa mali var. pyri (nom. inval.)]